MDEVHTDMYAMLISGAAMVKPANLLWCFTHAVCNVCSISSLPGTTQANVCNTCSYTQDLVMYILTSLT